MSSTPHRVTRSMSQQPQPQSTEPPVSTISVTSAGAPIFDSTLFHDTNPYNVDLVIPYDIKVEGKDKLFQKNDIRRGFEDLLKVLDGAGGLKVATRTPPAGKNKKGVEEVWVFISARPEKIQELAEIEQLLDEEHSLPPVDHSNLSPSTRLRLLYNSLVYPAVQHGLGITPGQGQWQRVKGIVALHDEEADKKWIEKWTKGADWRIGLIKGLEGKEGTGLGEHQPPPVHLYFDFLTTYTLSLLPLSLISILVWLFTKTESYPPLYGFILSLYSVVFVAYWRIKERKLAVRWGTRGSESVAVSRLRPEYIAHLGINANKQVAVDSVKVDTLQAGDDLKRDMKVAASVPLIIFCGIILGFVITGIFLLEAFVAHAYDGVGKQIAPLLPTGLFVLVVPQIVGVYQTLSKMLVKWEDHPTPVGEEKSLTAKTFAMNAIVSYLQLFLSAYVYVPFGPYIMANIQHMLTGSKLEGKNIKFAKTPEKAGLGPRTAGDKQKTIKAGRLQGQLFAYTVTSQAFGAFLEVGMPFIMRFINDWRNGKTTLKEAVKHRGEKPPPPKTEEEVEKRFLEKVQRELSLPEYKLFTDYAEIVTQFGYVTIWSIVWPLATVSALINNYFELRSDAMKICKHVQRPIGDRVESIGTWLHTLSIISWVGAVTNATLVFLFRPSTTLHAQSPNPEIPSTGSVYLHQILSTYDVSDTWKATLPTLVPLVAIALAASHGFIILRWVIDGVAERLLWRGSPEQVEVQKITAKGGKGTNEQIQQIVRRTYDPRALRGGFWNGGEEGAKVIGSVGKSE